FYINLISSFFFFEIFIRARALGRYIYRIHYSTFYYIREKEMPLYQRLLHLTIEKTTLTIEKILKMYLISILLYNELLKKLRIKIRGVFIGVIENKKAKNAFENLLSRQYYLVTQANELAKAFGNLKSSEHKILDYCFSYIKKEDTADTVYHLTLQEILKHLGLNASGENYTRVAGALNRLHEKTALYL